MTSLSARFLTFTGITLMLLASACSDDESAPSKRPLLIGKQWTTVYYEMDGEDITDDREACEEDNTTTFFEDGTFTDDIGTVLCEESETNVQGTWEFKANETIISLRPAGETASDWKIVELTASTLKISQYIQQFQAEVVVVMIPL
jgi:hypothetical protein